MKFILNKDTLKIENEDRINAGAVNYYEADVEYDESWNGLTIECVIVKKNNDVGNSIAVINKKMFIDQNLNGLYSIGFVGYTIEDNKKIYQISTNLKTLHFYKGAGEIKTENTDLPTPTEWEVYIAQIQELLKNMGNGTSEEGTTDYNKLENKPQINGIELNGNKTLEELGILGETDTTLTKSGVPADAKTVGDKFDFFRKYNGWIDTNTGVYIDTSAKTLTFGANSFITYGNQKINVGNTTHDISTMINGNFVYYDLNTKTLTKQNGSGYVIYLGALWKPNHLADFHMDKRKLFIDGMPVSYIGRYHNKTINCLGDSMTEGVGTTKAYHQWFGQLCGFKTINNYGVGGSCIAPKVDEIPTWEEGILSFYERYNDMSSADVITVFGGVNDWCTGRELGNITDTTANTFYGAMKLLCEGLISKYPTSDIFVFSSPQCDYINRPANDLSGTKWAGNTEGYNRKGYKLQDYANAMSEVCAIYGIPFCSMTNNLFYGLSGVLGDHNGTSGAYGSDALHPNADGHKKIALRMASVINSGIGNSPVVNESKYELIETVEVTEDGVQAFTFNFNLNKLVLYIKTPVATEAVDCGINVFKGNDKVGYAWLSGVCNTSNGRSGSFEARIENGFVVCENTATQNDIENKSNTQLYRKTWLAIGDSPLTRLYMWGGGAKALPIGTTLELWGVKA